MITGTSHPTCVLSVFKAVLIPTPTTNPIGPSTIKVSSPAISSVRTGLKKNFTIFGITLSRNPSIYFSEMDIKITGMTVEL